MKTPFPFPLADETAWPWAEEASSAPHISYKQNDLPKISIITPSFNQGLFLEETIRSVLLQRYPKLEYIIIDGGSTDNSVEVIKKYEPWLTYWESEPDRGQSHALNKGFSKATGEIYGWLNSDDYFMPGALIIIAKMAKKNPDAVAWVGGCIEINKEGTIKNITTPRLGDKNAIGNWGHDAHFYQPACLFSSEKFKKIKGLNEKLHFIMDIDLWMRLSETGSFISTNQVLAAGRIYQETKTLSDAPMREIEYISVNFNHDLTDNARKRLITFTERYLSQHFFDILLKVIKTKGLVNSLQKILQILIHWIRCLLKPGSMH